MRKITLAILFLAFFGCKNFQTEKLSTEEVLRQKLEHFAWNEVDTYPSFASCGGIIEKTAAKKCFVKTLSDFFRASFSKHQIIASDSIDETAYLYLMISKKGVPAIDSMQIPFNLQKQFPDMETRLFHCLDSLPEISPATKRGIPVAVKFVLPIKVVAK